VGLGPVDGELAQQARLGKLAQGVVHGGRGQRKAGRRGLGIEFVRRDVTMSLAEQQPPQADTLPGQARERKRRRR
jgi:hypothetical protein